ncbi:hypothetical protein SESBI_20755 [Sesbania bispinosa]|nr:hypothetical protein SESBI_20755 [Sesbania bispinosa]
MDLGSNSSNPVILDQPQDSLHGEWMVVSRSKNPSQNPDKGKNPGKRTRSVPLGNQGKILQKGHSPPVNAKKNDSGSTIGGQIIFQSLVMPT